jgi:hypothetical protein
MNRLNPAEAERCFMDWVRAIQKAYERDVVAIDGKTARGHFKAGEGGGKPCIMCWTWPSARMGPGYGKINGLRTWGYCGRWLLPWPGLTRKPRAAASDGANRWPSQTNTWNACSSTPALPPLPLNLHALALGAFLFDASCPCAMYFSFLHRFYP